MFRYSVNICFFAILVSSSCSVIGRQHASKKRSPSQSTGIQSTSIDSVAREQQRRALLKKTLEEKMHKHWADSSNSK